MAHRSPGVSGLGQSTTGGYRAGRPGVLTTGNPNSSQRRRNSVAGFQRGDNPDRRGVDTLSVVDPQLRVHSIDGLTVADASIMPTITTGNTNGPSLMIGERAADFILGARASAPHAESHS